MSNRAFLPPSEVPVQPLREALLQHGRPARAPAEARGAQVQVQLLREDAQAEVGAPGAREDAHGGEAVQVRQNGLITVMIEYS